MTTATQTLEVRGKVQKTNFLALLLGIVGTVAMIITQFMPGDNRLNSFGLMAVLAIVGILLNFVAAYAPKYTSNPYISFVAVVGAIGLYTAVLGNMVSSRIILISALFTWDPDNMSGWSNFYVTVVGLVALLLAVLLLIIGAFAYKESEQA